MKIKEFWNQAFLASLTRVPPDQAALDADDATELCIRKWQVHARDWVEPGDLLWQEQVITNVPFDTLRDNLVTDV